MDNRVQVREFLASRRARITPGQAGLPAYGGNRRVTGLRREEVAMLAGVSIDYRPHRPLPGHVHSRGTGDDRPFRGPAARRPRPRPARPDRRHRQQRRLRPVRRCQGTGSRALESTIDTLRKRIEDFQKRTSLAASTDFPPRRQTTQHLPRIAALPEQEHEIGQSGRLLALAQISVHEIGSIEAYFAQPGTGQVRVRHLSSCQVAAIELKATQVCPRQVKDSRIR